MSRISLLWISIRDSLWFLPSLGVLFAVALAFGIVAWEATADPAAALRDHRVFGVGAEGARGLLGSIASGLITVTGVIFSVTIVALQLASSQLSPRVMRSFVSDRANQVVLAIFIGTFTYALLVMRSIRSEQEDYQEFVPNIAVSVAVVLLLVSVAALIYFVHHVARSIQVSVLIDREAGKTMSAIPGMYPSDIGVPVRDETIDSLHREGAPATIRAPKDGYLQTLDPHRLFEAIGGLPVVVRVERRLGDFVMTGEALARVWPAELVNVERASGITGAFAIAAERTAEQDIEYALIGLSDIAVKALSPSINDPTTAVLCIDRLGEILLAIGRRELPHRIRTDQMGHARVLVPGSDLARAAGVAIRQIAHHGASNPGVVKRLLDILARVGALLPPERRDSLRVEFDYVVDCARSQLELPADLQDVERVLHELESAVSEGAGGAQRPAVDRLTSSRPPAPEPSRHR